MGLFFAFMENKYLNCANEYFLYLVVVTRTYNFSTQEDEAGGSFEENKNNIVEPHESHRPISEWDIIYLITGAIFIFSS